MLADINMESANILMFFWISRNDMRIVVEEHNSFRRDDSPDIWNNATKLRMIISMVLGLTYLHNQWFVHRELKPTDLIVQDDGSSRICGYLTNIFEHFKFTQASEVGAPSYMAPDIYDKETATRRT
jgi:serine/threonine protein kinase